MQMKRKHIYEDLLISNIMAIHGYSSLEIRRMSEHQALTLYNEIFAPIDKGDTYTIEDNTEEEVVATTFKERRIAYLTPYNRGEGS